jgi:hypothetical protein
VGEKCSGGKTIGLLMEWKSKLKGFLGVLKGFGVSVVFLTSFVD